MTIVDILLRPEDFDKETRNISNSEVTSYLACKRQYDFSFIEQITPNVLSVPLDRGGLGHNAFERYILARLNGADHEKALQAGLSAFLDAIKINPDRIDTYMFTQQVWLRYMNRHQGWPEWELLGTEVRVDFPLTDTIKIAIRYDLKVRELATGKILIGDWKFAYDFWKDDDHLLNPQMPKYIGVLRLNGLQCDGGFVEQVRTRPLGAEKARDHRNTERRNYYYPSQAKIRSMMKQHVAASLEIEKHRALPADIRVEQASIPVLNKFGPCGYCAFTGLCNSMNEGVSLDGLAVEIRTNFTKNTYGYNEGQTVPGQLQTVDDLKELL